ncbi:MAG: hypothetical protein OIF58_10695, partial [Cohaesibacter sp.]|nr:hypothetical protein [Cohaesibacter sp.]
MEVIASIGGQCQEIEQRIGQLQEQTTEEVLTNQSVSVDEVRRNLDLWRPALMSEYNSLKELGAICPVSSAEVEALHEKFIVETLPTLLVAVRKPSKLKARVVACGNFAQPWKEESFGQSSNSAGGVDTITVRALASIASDRGLSLLTADIKTAFLQAPRRPTPGRVTVLTPPSILREAQCLEMKDEVWVVEKAMYGLAESPKDWGDFRNWKMS